MLFLIPLFANSGMGQGRVLDFSHLSLEDGLSEGTVNRIVQDRRGFIWFGTQDGLNRYDGHTFLVFRNDPSEPASLSDNYVTSLCVDSKGRLWVGTQQGHLDRLDEAHGTFEKFGNLLVDSANGEKADVTGIVEDNDGAMWLATLGRGIVRLDPSTRVIRRYLHAEQEPGSLSHNSAWSLILDRAGALWIGTFDGLNRYDALRDRFDVFRIPHASGETVQSNINALGEDPQGNLWCAAWKSGLYRFDGQSGSLVHFTVPGLKQHSLDPRIFTFYIDAKGTIWVGTASSGLQRIQGTNLETFQNEPDNPRSLTANQITSLFADRSGLLWVGTNSGGVNRIPLSHKLFDHYRHVAGDPNSINANSVWAFHEDRQKNLWVGTLGGGLDRIEAGKEKVTHFGGSTPVAAGLTSSQVTAILEDGEGMLWVGTQDAGLYRSNKAKSSFTRFAHNAADPTSLGTDVVNCVFEDSAGVIWVGTFGGGLDRFDAETRTFTRFLNDPRNPSSMGGNSAMTIIGARNGGLWIGTYTNGVDRYVNGAFTHYRNDPANPNTLNNDRIESLYEDSSGVLWVGTWGGGLNRLDPSTGRWSHVTTREGLPNSTVYGILPDARGNLWLSTNKGIVQFNPATSAIRCYDVNDGLQHNEFNQGAHLKLQSGEMLFGGLNGFTRFHPDSLPTQGTPPPVVLTTLKVFGAESPAGMDVSSSGELELRYDQNFFSIDFAALDFANPAKNRFAYRIEGYDKTWVQAGSGHTATYTNVEPGKYTFRVTACNSNGVWNTEGATLIFTIRPPLWKTWWAYILYCVIAVVLLGTLLRRRHIVHLKQVREQEHKLREGTRQLEHERLISQSLRQAEEKLSLSEKRLRQIIDLIPHFIFAKDADGTFILANKAMSDALGTTVEDLTGKAEADFGITREELLRSREVDLQVIQSGLPQDIPEETVTDGTGRKRVLSTHKIPFTFSGSSSPAVLGVSVDVTERKLAESALRKSERDFRQLFDNANEVIVIFEPEGEIILEANDAACDAYGFDHDTLVGMSLEALTLNPAKGKHLIDKTLESGSHKDFESIHLNSRGEQVHFLINASVIEYRDKKVILSIHRDVTERRRAEEALRQGQKLKSIGTLAGGIAHDFNNLLNAVLGQSILALKKLPKESPAGSNISKAIKATERAADLTRQLLAYSGKGKLTAEYVDLNLLVKENAQILELSIPKTANLRIDSGSPSPWISGDVGQIQQVIMNLMINAGEAIGANPGYITLRTDTVEITPDDTPFWKFTNDVLPPGRYALLQVSDTGHGMKPETLDHIFDPFFTTKFMGRGLGLAAVLGIIRGHRGGVRIVSSEGNGTRFDVVFPLADSSGQLPAPESATGPVLRGNGKTILVIDDESSVLELLTDVLMEAEFRVMSSLHPVEGIELYRLHRDEIALVLLDYSMPEMNGKKAFEELVKIDKDVRVLLSSGYSEEDTSSVFGELRPAGFVNKPYRPEALIARISRILAV